MSLFNKFKIGLGKSSSGLTDGFKNVFSKKKIDEDVLTKFEELIISADAGVDVARELRKDFENFKIDKKLDDHKEILKLIAEKMAIGLLKYEKDLSLMGNAKSAVIVVSGVNGAGKTTLISTVCGITVPTGGTALVAGHDIITEYRQARSAIGLVPQEINLEPFETVWNATRLTRGLFGKRRDDKLLEQILRRLSLWDKKDSQIKELSGGMKRRVLIAKALSHEPRVLFLDEPTAGVDVELRKDMWDIVADLKTQGVTGILCWSRKRMR